MGPVGDFLETTKNVETSKHRNHQVVFPSCLCIVSVDFRTNSRQCSSLRFLAACASGPVSGFLMELGLNGVPKWPKIDGFAWGEITLIGVII